MLSCIRSSPDKRAALPFLFTGSSHRNPAQAASPSAPRRLFSVRYMFIRYLSF